MSAQVTDRRQLERDVAAILGLDAAVERTSGDKRGRVPRWALPVAGMAIVGGLGAALFSTMLVRSPDGSLDASPAPAERARVAIATSPRADASEPGDGSVKPPPSAGQRIAIGPPLPQFPAAPLEAERRPAARRSASAHRREGPPAPPAQATADVRTASLPPPAGREDRPAITALPEAVASLTGDAAAAPTLPAISAGGLSEEAPVPPKPPERRLRAERSIDAIRSLRRQ